MLKSTVRGSQSPKTAPIGKSQSKRKCPKMLNNFEITQITPIAVLNHWKEIECALSESIVYFPPPKTRCGGGYQHLLTLPKGLIARIWQNAEIKSITCKLSKESNIVNSSNTTYTFLPANLLQFQSFRLLIRCRFSGRGRVYGQAGNAAKIHQQLYFKFVGILMELESEWI